MIGGALGGKKRSLGLKRSMPCHDLVKVESLVSKKSYRGRFGPKKRLRMSRSARREAAEEDSIDMWALMNPASAALDASNFDVFFPKAIDMEGDLLFVLPSAPIEKAALVLPPPRSLVTSKCSIKSPCTDVGDVTRELAIARIAFST